MIYGVLRGFDEKTRSFVDQNPDKIVFMILYDPYGGYWNVNITTKGGRVSKMPQILSTLFFHGP